MTAPRLPPLWMAPMTQLFFRWRFPREFLPLSAAHSFSRVTLFPISPPPPFSPARYPKWKQSSLRRRLCFRRSLVVLTLHKIFHISPYPETPEWKIVSVRFFVLPRAERRCLPLRPPPPPRCPPPQPCRESWHPSRDEKAYH